MLPSNPNTYYTTCPRINQNNYATTDSNATKSKTDEYPYNFRRAPVTCFLTKLCVRRQIWMSFLVFILILWCLLVVFSFKIIYWLLGITSRFMPDVISNLPKRYYILNICTDYGKSLVHDFM